MPSRFVRPDTTTLQLSDGDWLVVKRRLTAGEQRAAFARMYLAGADGQLRVNPLGTGVARITAYLLDWSLKDDDGKPVVIRDVSVEALTAALDNLTPESFAEINRAIEQHEETEALARTEEKKLKAGIGGADPISPSLSGAGGGSNGSGLSTQTTTQFS